PSNPCNLKGIQNMVRPFPEFISVNRHKNVVREGPSCRRVCWHRQYRTQGIALTNFACPDKVLEVLRKRYHDGDRGAAVRGKSNAAILQFRPERLLDPGNLRGLQER